jgi:copper transport protein
MGQRIFVTLFVGLLALAWAGVAEAHATLVRSDPAAGAVLDIAPTQVILEFSEALDPSFSRAQLFDGKNQLVEAGPGRIDPAEPRVLRLLLVNLPKDSYTTIWRVRSAADGHITQGSLPFGVGVEANTTALIPPPGAPDPATLPPPPLDALGRWLNLLTVTIAFGGLPFGLLVWRPALRSVAHHPESTRPRTENREPRTGGPRTTDHGPRTTNDPLVLADAIMARALRRLILVGSGLFLVANLLFLIVQAAAAAEVPLARAIGAPLLQLLSGRSGLLWLARIALTFQIGALSWRLPPPGQGPTRLWWATLLIAGVVLLTLSMSSHAAATPGAAIAVLLDWLHIVAMVAWLGGLIPLAFASASAWRTPSRGPAPAALIRRFTWLAAACVATLTLTGVYSYILHIDRLDLLAATTYGRALLIKLGLFGALLLLGGLNMLVLAPRLRAPDSRFAGMFKGTLRAELVAGALLLLAVGAMTSVAPSKTAWEAHERLGVAQAASEGDVDLVLRVAPAQIGDNEFAIDVTDPRPGAAAAASKVLLRFDMIGMEMGNVQTEARATSAQRYTARGNFTSMGGRWQIEVILRRAGFDDVRHTFQVDIGLGTD